MEMGIKKFFKWSLGNKPEWFSNAIESFCIDLQSKRVYTKYCHPTSVFTIFIDGHTDRIPHRDFATQK